jgi:hypothetical protein
MAIKTSQFGKPVLPARQFNDHRGMLRAPNAQEAELLLDSLKRQIASTMTPAEINEFDQVLEFMSRTMESGGGRFPGGDVKAFIRQTSPSTQYWLNEFANFIEEPRQMPFMAKRSEAENAARLGLDPQMATLIKGSIDGTSVKDGVRDRLNKHDSENTFRRPPKGPEGPSLRDHVAAAADQLEPRANAENYVNEDLADAGQGHTLRSALTTLIEHTEDRDGQYYGPDQ